MKINCQICTEFYALTNNSIYTWIVLAIASCLVVGCGEDVTYLTEVQEQKFVLQCELDPSEVMTATLQTISALDGRYSGGIIPDAEIVLFTGRDEKIYLEYQPDLRKYVAINGLKPKAELTYQIRVIHPDYEDMTILSDKYSFPPHLKVEQTEAINSVVNNEVDPKSVEIKYLMPNNTPDDSYYHLEFYYRAKSAKGYSGLKPIETTKIYNDNFVVQKLNHRDGVVVDHNRLDDEPVSLKLNAASLAGGEVISAVYVKTYTVSKDYFQFHTSKSNQLSGAATSSSVPVIEYSNVPNGFGIFTTKVSRMDSIQVR